MAKDDAITTLRSAIEKLDQSISALTREQLKTNELLRGLVTANTSFLGTLTVFLDKDHRIKMEKERRDLEQAKSKSPTDADLRY